MASIVIRRDVLSAANLQKSFGKELLFHLFQKPGLVSAILSDRIVKPLFGISVSITRSYSHLMECNNNPKIEKSSSAAIENANASDVTSDSTNRATCSNASELDSTDLSTLETEPTPHLVNSTKENQFCNDTKRRKRKHGNCLHSTFKRQKLTSDDVLSLTSYYFENGLRKVVPYDFNYNTFCKGRWVGKTLGELYTSEFRLYPIEYYEKAVSQKRILVNLKPVKTLGHIVRDNDLITSVGHRHECPVSAAPIEIIADNDDFFVINKPCTLPLHPVGRFRYNSVLSILAREFNKRDIFSIHRLDRMTSGLTVFTKSKEVAKKCHIQIKERQVEKEYICRVIGDFTTFTLPEGHDHKIIVVGDEVTISEPLKVYDMKVGTSIVSRDEDAKESATTIRCLSTDGKTSVLSCKPKTGRTHQIRVHLQYLGFPITNDTLYNSPAWGEERFHLGAIKRPLDTVIEELTIMKKWTAVLESFEKSTKEEKQNEGCTGSPSDAEETVPNLSPALLEAAAKIKSIVPYREDCEECKVPLPDPKPEELVMYLHAHRYKGPDWAFETPLPKWATSNWKDSS